MCSGLGSFTSGLRGHFTEDGLLLTLPSSGRLTRRSMPKHSSCSQTTMFAKAERQCVTSPARVAGRHGNVAVAVLAIVIEQVHEQLLARLPFQAPGPSRVLQLEAARHCVRHLRGRPRSGPHQIGSAWLRQIVQLHLQSSCDSIGSVATKTIGTVEVETHSALLATCREASADSMAAQTGSNLPTKAAPFAETICQTLFRCMAMSLQTISTAR
ncbi:unnamed protein product [Symbiodinium natans]|uniref:Uncharacterized protein n=1 Tax=Symbiodinium natans TaxID=878477 RepID=A0A812JZL1_9DINO|nr:unnamed protein product [Symbiodinium natans]